MSAMPMLAPMRGLTTAAHEGHEAEVAGGTSPAACRFPNMPTERMAAIVASWSRWQTTPAQLLELRAELERRTGGAA